MTFFDYYLIYTIIAMTLGLCGCLVLALVWMWQDIKNDEKGRK